MSQPESVFDLRLCLITDRAFCPPERFLPILAESLDAGVTWVQYREKRGLDDRASFELALQVRELTRARGIPLVVDDRLDLALAIDADGMHVGQRDLPVPVIRKLWPHIPLLGLTVSTLAQVEEACQLGVDYLGAGAFPTQTKLDCITIGTPGLQTFVAQGGLPVIATGGVKPENTRELIATGCAGVAVVSAIWAAERPGEIVQTLRREIDAGLAGPAPVQACRT
ncbi:MAG: Thiamine-phosphate pyrophosphorylase [Proteobacteria bacterium]|nr:Thiamine-phosphate pyrophosphorylase [Pseudomonadota bacterium]